MTWRSACLAVILLGLGLTQLPGDAGAQAWKRLRPADFPAWVDAVMFDQGVWDGTRTTWVWGQWTARFDKQPVARFVQCDNAVCPSFRIEDLVCTNPVVGESPCALAVSWRLAFGNATCVLNVKKEKTAIVVTCPVDVKFK